ncbi:diguanylate cyclase [Ilyobacter sp.]|uniref:diguanylate cyclase n=1 Tax=Ilyobacter sp. TaxID=3100343 RepID=UPI00356492FD
MINKQLKYIFDNSYEGVYIIDKYRKIIYWNPIGEKLSGYTVSEVVGSYCHDNILDHIDQCGMNLCKDGCPLDAVLKDGIIREAKVFLKHKNGYRVPINVRGIPFKNDKNEIIGAIEFFNETSEREIVLEKIKNLESLAFLDHLTQLPNRRYLENFIKIKSEEYLLNNQSFGIVFMDVDHFKSVNETYGHKIGDLVLETISKTFLNNLRKNDVIGRWGGEEFAGIFSVKNIKELSIVSEKLRNIVENTEIVYKDKKLKVTISIGATFINNKNDVLGIIENADKLMYESKRKGRNCITIG